MGVGWFAYTRGWSLTTDRALLRISPAAEFVG